MFGSGQVPGKPQKLKETPLSKIARRKFIQLSAVAAAGCLASPGRRVFAQDLPQLTEDDAMANAMKYTHDSSTVDPASRANPAAEQDCANCALIPFGRRRPDRRYIETSNAGVPAGVLQA